MIPISLYVGDTSEEAAPEANTILSSVLIYIRDNRLHINFKNASQMCSICAYFALCCALICALLRSVALCQKHHFFSLRAQIERKVSAN